MLRTIRILKPSFVVGENVAGLVSMENGKTLERILSDLENEGYQTESFIIPACAVGAWHRRDRIWIVAYSTSNGISRQDRESNDVERTGQTTNDKRIRGQQQAVQYEGLDDLSWDASNTECNGCEDGHQKTERTERKSEQGGVCKFEGTGNQWDVGNASSIGLEGSISSGEFGKQNRKSKKASTISEHLYNDKYRIQSSNSTTESNLGMLANGLPFGLVRWDREPEGVPRVATGVKDRVNRLKGLGNAIVPQVAYQIFKAIEQYNNLK